MGDTSGPDRPADASPRPRGLVARRLASGIVALAIVTVPFTITAAPAFAVPTPPTTNQTYIPWYTDYDQTVSGVIGSLTDLEGTTRIDVYVTQTPADPLSWTPYCSDGDLGGSTVWVCDSATGSLSPGLNYLAATATNIDGESARGPDIQINLVTTTVITSPGPGAFTNDDTPDWTGTADPALVGDQVDVRIGGATLCSATILATGDWACTTAPPLVEGTHNVYAFTTTNPGFISSDRSITIDTTPPAEAVITSPPATGPPVVFVYPAETDDPTPVIAGTSEPGATINLYQNYSIAACAGGAPIADGAGNWSCTITTPLTVGQFYEFGTTNVDTAGNISTMGTPDTQILLEI
ncbi:MAG TPA: Ig-like domain-containing protein, partial [Terrimesophilobacter sp.]|nr:Ig-like domain-containing protein [Terrimesophilobacter sp.]